MKNDILKSLTVLFFMVTANHHTMAQSKEEQEIRKLERIETTAILKGDTTTLLATLWSPELVVNNPANIVVTRPQIVALIKAGKIDYASFDRIIEKISIIDHTAIVMGREEIKPEGVTDHAGKIVVRRFTNVWVKDKKSNWKMVARQATISSIK